MSKITFTMTQINQLEENPNVASVSERSIQYTTEFNVRAVRENMEGKGPQQIFTEAGFDLTVIGDCTWRCSLPSVSRSTINGFFD